MITRFLVIALLVLAALNEADAKVRFMHGFEGCEADYDETANTLIFSNNNGTQSIHYDARKKYCNFGKDDRGKLCTQNADCESTCEWDADNTCSIAFSTSALNRLLMGSDYLGTSADSARLHFQLNIPKLDVNFVGLQDRELAVLRQPVGSPPVAEPGCNLRLVPTKNGNGGQSCTSNADCMDGSCTANYCDGTPGEYKLVLYYGDPSTVCSGGINDGTACTPCSGETCSSGATCYNGTGGQGACDDECIAETEGEQWCISSSIGSSTILYTNRWYEIVLSQDNTVGGGGDVKCSLDEGGFSRGFRTVKQGVCDAGNSLYEGYACSIDADCNPTGSGGLCDTSRPTAKITSAYIGSDRTGIDNSRSDVAYYIDDIVLTDSADDEIENVRIAEIWPFEDGTTQAYQADFGSAKTNCGFSDCDNNSNNGNRDACVNDTSRADSLQTALNAPDYDYVHNGNCDRRNTSSDGAEDLWPLTDYDTKTSDERHSDLEYDTASQQSRWADVLSAASYVVARDSSPSDNQPTALLTRFGFGDGTSGFEPIDTIFTNNHTYRSDFDNGMVQGVGSGGSSPNEFAAAAMSLVNYSGSFTSLAGPSNISDLQLQVEYDRAACASGCGNRYTAAVVEVLIPRKAPTPPGVLTDRNGDGDVTVCMTADSTGNQGTFTSFVTSSSDDIDNFMNCTRGSKTLAQLEQQWPSMLDGEVGGTFNCFMTKGIASPCDYMIFGPIGVNDLTPGQRAMHRCEAGPKKGVTCEPRCAVGDSNAGDLCNRNADCNGGTGTCDNDYECPDSECVFLDSGYCYGGANHADICKCDEDLDRLCIVPGQYFGVLSSTIDDSDCTDELSCTTNSDCTIDVPCSSNADCRFCGGNGNDSIIFGCYSNTDCDVLDLRINGSDRSDFGQCTNDNGTYEQTCDTGTNTCISKCVGGTCSKYPQSLAANTRYCSNDGSPCLLDSDCPAGTCKIDLFAGELINRQDNLRAIAPFTGFNNAACLDPVGCPDGVCLSSNTPALMQNRFMRMIEVARERSVHLIIVAQPRGLRNIAFGACSVDDVTCSTNSDCPVSDPCRLTCTNKDRAGEYRACTTTSDCSFLYPNGVSANLGTCDSKCVGTCQYPIEARDKECKEHDNCNYNLLFGNFGNASDEQDAFSSSMINYAKANSEYSYADYDRAFHVRCPGRNHNDCFNDTIHWDEQGFAVAQVLIQQCLRNSEGASDGDCNLTGAHHCTTNADCATGTQEYPIYCDSSNKCTGTCTQGADGDRCHHDNECSLYSCTFD
jgi:hypothetical protein